MDPTEALAAVLPDAEGAVALGLADEAGEVLARAAWVRSGLQGLGFDIGRWDGRRASPEAVERLALALADGDRVRRPGPAALERYGRLALRIAGRLNGLGFGIVDGGHP